MKPTQKLLHNYITKDLTKIDIDKFERAELIRQYLTEQKLTIRKLAERLHTKKSTIDGWLLWGKITKEHHERLKQRGFTETKIRSMLRGDTKNIKNINIDYEFNEWIIRINHFIKKPEYTKDTTDLIRTMKDKLNRLWAKIEQNMKNGR